MKLSIPEIRALKKLLQVDNEVSSDGKPVLRKFSTKEFSAYNWFFKNTEEAEKEYNEFIKKEKEVLDKKYKKDEDKQDAELKAIKELLVKHKEEGKEKELLTQLQKLLTSMPISRKIDNELNTDEKIQAEADKEHEIEVKDNTKDLIEKVLETAQFTAQDIVLLKVIDKFV